MNWIELIVLVMVIIVSITTFVTEPRVSLDFGKAWISSGYKVLNKIWGFFKSFQTGTNSTVVKAEK